MLGGLDTTRTRVLLGQLFLKHLEQGNSHFLCESALASVGTQGCWGGGCCSTRIPTAGCKAREGDP